jgi:outer membrane receptor protein involved in Fe transport
MMRKIYLLIFLLSSLVITTYGQMGSGELRGKVTDNSTKEGVPFAVVVMEQNGIQIASVQTDFDGNYSIKPIPPGKYDLKIKIIGYNDRTINGIIVTSNKQAYVNPEMTSNAVQTGVVDVTDYKVPLIDRDETTTGGTITADEIKKLPTRNINSLVSTTAGVYQAEEGGALNIKGSRSDANEIYIDGVKVRGAAAVPQGGIEQVSVITGGVPAQYGDATGGIISVTTKGPSKNLTGGIEGVTSEFLDGFGYNLVSGNLSGPIYTQNKGTDQARPLVGFFISAELESKRDQDPSAAAVYETKSDALKNVQDNPLIRGIPGRDVVPSAEFIRLSDLKKVKAQNDNESRVISFTSRVDFQPNLNSTFSIGFSGSAEKSRFYQRPNMLFNSAKNPEIIRNNYRVFARYTQKFNNSEQESALLKNAYYSLQFDYSKEHQIQQDPDLKDNFFQYGNYGKYTFRRSYAEDLNQFGAAFTLSNGQQINYANIGGGYGFRDLEVFYEPSSYNPYLTPYTEQYIDFIGQNPVNLTQLTGGRGLANGSAITQVYGGLWNMPGHINDLYVERDRDQYRFSASASADIKQHSIQIGFEIEQRIEAQYTISPRGLWTTMRALANDISTNGLNGTIGDINGDGTIDVNDTMALVHGDTLTIPLYDLPGGYFAQSVRAKLGLSNSDFVDVDSYDPETYSLDMFSAQELLDQRLVGAYYGYDYTGKRDKKRYSFDDFFNDTVNRPVGAFRPVYLAGYIQDKFTFKDIIFNLGVRVDRFDANQPVSFDKYSVYKTRSKSEVPGSLNLANGGSHPANIGDDYTVYVDNAVTPTKILGYRSENVFYDAFGNITDDANTIASKGIVTPYLSQDAVNQDTQQPVLNGKSFKDYEPQVQVMPRISFSFPISDEANFFANYDVLTQRPRINNNTNNGIVSNPINYYRMAQKELAVVPNPELRPEKRINYQFGFKQRVSQTSAITLTAFYSELKDNFQIVNVDFAYPLAQYQTYENIDFGTVKGLTLSYDLRRTNNVRVNAAYTLQFANGTGSASNSANNLLQSGEGQIRIPMALDYDQRHTFVTTFDYRYASGAAYNGPASMRNILENAGLNVIFRAGSGTPYSRIDIDLVQDALNATDTRFRKLIGEINGSRLPWEFNVDLRLDKDFQFNSNSENGAGKSSYLNVYLLVQNVFNTLRVASVYPATGSPNDDGYLSSQQAQSALAEKADVNSYIDLYNVYINDPDNYRSPRIIRVGASYNF